MSSVGQYWHKLRVSLKLGSHWGWVILAFILTSCHWHKQLRSSEYITEDLIEDSCIEKDPTMMTLAQDLDRITTHLDWYGSVVPKAPDVWGQARLTAHREDFENQMQGDLGQFNVLINGSESRKDSAFLNQVFSLSNAVGGMPASTNSGGTAKTGDSLLLDKNQSNSLSPSAGQSPNSPTATLPSPTGISPAAAAKSDIVPVYGSIGLEPTRILAQKARPPSPLANGK